MLDFTNKIDTDIFLFLNGLHHEWLDSFMLAISYNNYLIAGLIIFLMACGFKYYKKFFPLAFLFSLIAFGLSDSISTRVFKDGFERLRPCHNPALAEKVYLAAQNCGGGKFGFVSSHASNSFALAVFFWLLFRKKNRHFKWIFLYAGMVSYSRIYLARHYPADIVFGAILGILIACMVFKLYKLVSSIVLQKGTKGPTT